MENGGKEKSHLIKVMEVEVATRRGNLLWAELRGKDWGGAGKAYDLTNPCKTQLSS